MSTEALFVMAKGLEGLKCASADDWIKMWHSHRMKHYAAIKRNEALIDTVTWMSLGNMQSERSQTRKSVLSLMSTARIR